MDNRESIKRKTYPPSFKTLFTSLIALFAVSGIAWASVELSSTRGKPSGNTGGTGNSGTGNGANYHSDHIAYGNQASGDDTHSSLLNRGRIANIGALPSAYRTTNSFHDDGWDWRVPNHYHTYFLNGALITDPGSPDGGAYNRVSVSTTPRVAGSSGNNPFLFNYGNSGGGGGGGGGGGKTNPDNQQPVTTSGTLTDVIVPNANSPINGNNTLNGGSQTPMTPVPEPQTYVMLASGLSMLGIIARRRRATNICRNDQAMTATSLA